LAGDFFYNQQQMDKANDYYNQVLAKDPSNFESAAKLAFIAEQSESHQDSLAAWRRAAVIAPDDPLPLEQMLASAKSTGEAVNAEATILDIAQANDSGVPYAVLAMYFADLGVLTKAKDYEAKLISRSPDAATLKSVKLSIYYAIAKTEYIAKNFPAARENALAGLSLEARSPLLLILLTEIEVAGKNYTEAQKLVDQIRAGNELIGNELQGDLYMVQSQAAPAVEVYRSVWQRQTSNKLAAKLYASLSASDADQAQVFLAEWNAKYPRSSSALGARATNYLLAGEFNNAIPIMENIQSITPDSPLNLNNLAWAYHQVNNAKALPTAKRAYELAPESASIADTYGWILFRQGNISEAIEVLEKAVSMEPDNTEIAAHLQDAKKAQ
jgi:tetratricopeptide (TPR) repeat protein